MATTTNYGWEIPTVGTSAYAPKINTDLQSIDTTVKAVSDATVTAQAAATAAQTDATNALAGKLLPAAGTALTLTGSSPNYATTLDLSVAGPVYTINLPTVVGGGLISALSVTFSNRPTTTGRLVWLYISMTTGNIGTLRVQIAAASSTFVTCPLGLSRSGSISIVKEYDFTAAATWYVAVPFYVLGS